MLQGLRERAPDKSWLSQDVVEMFPASCGGILNQMNLIFANLKMLQFCGLGKEPQRLLVPLPNLSSGLFSPCCAHRGLGAYSP